MPPLIDLWARKNTYRFKVTCLPNSETISLKYKIKFDGIDADQHRLEAYPAAQSLEGLIWALALTLHFGVTGDIRARGDLPRSARIYISPPRRGSVINELNIIVNNNPFLVMTVGAYAVTTVTPYVNGLFKYVFNQALGEGGEFPTGAKKFLRKINGDDLDKLITRIEPPLTRAHSVIGKTANTICLKSKRTDLAILNSNTKDYLEAKVTDAFETIHSNVTSFNVLTGNGRLYDSEAGGTAAFSLSSSPRDGTKNTIISSMDQFASGRQGVIKIVVQRVETIDHRLKKFIISSAEKISPQDWVDGIDPMTAAR